MYILVFRINLATSYCHDSKDAILALEDGTQTAQPWTIDGQIINFHKVSPKEIKVITKLPNSEQSYKGKVKTHNYINRQNQSTAGKLWKP